MIRIKFGFHEKTYETLVKLANEHKVETSEIVRRALQLYANCNRELKRMEQVTVTHEICHGPLTNPSIESLIS